MNELIVSAQTESEMDDIWLYVARVSQNIETANRWVRAGGSSLRIATSQM